MDRKLNKLILAGLLSTGACQCHAQFDWGSGKSQVNATRSDQQTPMDWRSLPPARAAVTPVESQSPEGSRILFPQQVRTGAGPVSQSMPGLSWEQVPGSRPTFAAGSSSIPPQRTESPRDLWRTLPEASREGNASGRQHAGGNSSAAAGIPLPFGPFDFATANPAATAVSQPAAGTAKLTEATRLPSSNFSQALPAPSQLQNVPLAQNVTAARNARASQQNVTVASQRPQPVVTEAVRERLADEAIASVPAGDLSRVGSSLIPAEAALEPLAQAYSPDPERVIPNAARAVRSGMFGQTDEMVAQEDGQASLMNAECPAPLPEPAAFGLIESYQPVPQFEPNTVPFSVPPVEQVVSSTPPTTTVESKPPTNVSIEPTPAAIGLIPLELKTPEPSPSDRVATAPPIPASSNPTPDANEGQAYVLQSLRSQPEHPTLTANVVPIDILPMNRLIAAPQLTVEEKLTTERMTGPLTNPGMLFAKLHIDNDFRQLPAVPGATVRGSAPGSLDQWSSHSFAWVTPTFYHRPLYFEQENLERYGIGSSRFTQPIHSAAHFFMSVGLMPYKLTTQHPCEKVYTLGHNRPGDCVPYQERSLLGQSYPLEACRYFESYSAYR